MGRDRTKFSQLSNFQNNLFCLTLTLLFFCFSNSNFWVFFSFFLNSDFSNFIFIFLPQTFLKVTMFVVPSCRDPSLLFSWSEPVLLLSRGRHCWMTTNSGPETGLTGRWKRAEYQLGARDCCGPYLRYRTLGSVDYCLSPTGAKWAIQWPIPRDN